MRIMMLLALMQAPTDTGRIATFHEKPFNDTLTLSVTGRFTIEAGYEVAHLSVRLIDRRRPGKATVLLRMRDQGLEHCQVLRTDDSSIVIARASHYRSEPTLKFFLHPETKALRKTIEYPPDLGLPAVDASEIASLLGVPAHVVERLKKKPWDPAADSSHVPKELREHPMPPSSYDEFARARPRRVADGYVRDGTILEEKPGPYQIVGSRIWFGKVFYDGEGTSGVGGLGYFDTTTSQYRFVQVPGLADWSVSAILIEPDAAWIGLVGYPEGEPYTGGLIRYEFRSRTTRKFAIEEVIHQIVRWQDRLYVATKNGAYLVQGGRLVKRYRVEPNIDNRFTIVSEDLSSRP
jgi:hypothetical protein